MAMTKCETCGGKYNEFRIDEHCCGCTQLRTENANLKAYNATRTDELLGASHRIADLESENAELRKDAERWRTYLKVFDEEELVEAEWKGPKAITAYIDAAMKGGE